MKKKTKKKKNTPVFASAKKKKKRDEHFSSHPFYISLYPSLAIVVQFYSLSMLLPHISSSVDIVYLLFFCMCPRHKVQQKKTDGERRTISPSLSFSLSLSLSVYLRLISRSAEHTHRVFFPFVYRQNEGEEKKNAQR